ERMAEGCKIRPDRCRPAPDRENVTSYGVVEPQRRHIRCVDVATARLVPRSRTADSRPAAIEKNLRVTGPAYDMPRGHDDLRSHKEARPLADRCSVAGKRSHEADPGG